MYSKEIKMVITEYIKKQNAEYAIMIDGDWGSGKTYFIRNFLCDIINEDKNKRDKQCKRNTLEKIGKANEPERLEKQNKRKIAYVSLYGATSIDEVSKAIFVQCFGKRNERKIRNTQTAINTTGNIAAMFSAISIDFSEIQKTLAENRIQNWIICFDDLERCEIPINEILGYINGLVEHNHCKVIVLANEKEIGTAHLTYNLEGKYLVAILANRVKDTGEKSSPSKQAEGENLEYLKVLTDQIFREDILYKSVREKAIGLTLHFEAQLQEVFDSFARDYNDKKFETYLEDQKDNILQYFREDQCVNLRTLRAVLDSIKKIYDEMQHTPITFSSKEYFNLAMGEFLEYIVRFTIFFKQGGNVVDLGLTSEIGNIHFRHNLFETTRGFKFLEDYCATLKFSNDEFQQVLTFLYNEYEEEEKKKKSLKEGLAHAYDELSYWWDEEDAEVNEQIKLLWEEVKQDKYPFSKYEGIIGLLLILEKYEFEVGDINELILIMNQNIEKTDEAIVIERISFDFQGDEKLQKLYDEYVGDLLLLTSEKNRILQAEEIMQLLESENWAEELLKYCHDKHLVFYSRYGFIDLFDVDLFLKKLKTASTREWNIVREIFYDVYDAGNISDFFIRDKGKLKELGNAIGEMDLTEHHTRTVAKNRLFDELQVIIARLDK